MPQEHPVDVRLCLSWNSTCVKSSGQCIVASPSRAAQSVTTHMRQTASPHLLAEIRLRRGTQTSPGWPKTHSRKNPGLKNPAETAHPHHCKSSDESAIVVQTHCVDKEACRKGVNAVYNLPACQNARGKTVTSNRQVQGLYRCVQKIVPVTSANHYVHTSCQHARKRDTERKRESETERERDRQKTRERE